MKKEESMIKEHLFIVIGNEHYTPLAVVRSLGEEGIRPILIVRKGDYRITSLSKYLGKIHYASSVEEQFEILLSNYGDCEKKPFVYPCDDCITEYIDGMYYKLKDKFYFPNARTAGQIAKYMNKNNINLLAQKHGLNVARTWLVNKGEIPNDIEYPVITKTISSNSGAWKSDYHICNNRDELLAAYDVIRCEELLLQQFVEKRTEVCLDGVSVNNGSEVLYAIASTYTYSIPDYYSAEMLVTNSGEIPDGINILNSLNEMFKEIGYDGIFSVEFMLDNDDKMWFLEVNFRTSTWLYAATSLKMNLPIIWANCQFSKKLPQGCEKVVPQNYIAMAELVDFAFRVLRHKLSFREWLKKVRACNCFFFYNKFDKMPFWGALMEKTMGRIKRKSFNK